jgi:hypothetical protein
MAQLIYGGDHAAVFVVVDGVATIEAVKGEPVEVPDALADNLLESAAWSPASDKAAKPAKAKTAKHDDPADVKAEEGA